MARGYLRNLYINTNFNAANYLKDSSIKSPQVLLIFYFLNFFKSDKVFKINNPSKRKLFNKEKKILSQNETKFQSACKKIYNNLYSSLIKTDEYNFNNVVCKTRSDKSEKFISLLSINHLMRKTSYVLLLVVFTVNRLLHSLLNVYQNLKDFGISKYEIDTLDFQYVNIKSWVIYCICLFDLLYFGIINNDNTIFHKINHSENIYQLLKVKVDFIFKSRADKIKENKNFCMFSQDDINNVWKRIFPKNQNLKNMMKKKSIKFEKNIYENREFNYHKLFSKYLYLFFANILIKNEVSRNIGNYSSLVKKCTNIFIQNENEEHFKTISSISDHSILMKIDLIYKDLLKILIAYFTAAQNIASYEFKDYKTDVRFEIFETNCNLKSYIMMDICDSFPESYSGYVAKDGEVVFLIIQVKAINGNIFFSLLLATVEGYSNNAWLYYRYCSNDQEILILLAFFSLINLSTLILFSIFKAEVSSYLVKEEFCKYHFVINSYYILTWEFLMRNIVNLQSRIINFEIIQYKQIIIEKYQRRFLSSLFSKIKMCRFLPQLLYNNFLRCLNNGKYDFDVNVWERDYHIPIPESSIENFYFQDSTLMSDIIFLENFLYEIVPIPESNGGIIEAVEERGYFSSSDEVSERDGNVAIPESSTADFYFLDSFQISEIILRENFSIEIVPIPESGVVLEAVEEYFPIIFNNNNLLQVDSHLTADIVLTNEADDIILHDTEVENDCILQDDSHFAHDIYEDDKETILNEFEAEEIVGRISDNDNILKDDSDFPHDIYEDDKETIVNGIETEEIVGRISDNDDILKDDSHFPYEIYEDDKEIIVNGIEAEIIDNDNNIPSDSHISYDTLPTGDVVDGKYINEKTEGANCFNILQHIASNTEVGETQIDEGFLSITDTNMMPEVLFINQELNNDPVIKNTFYHLDPT